MEVLNNAFSGGESLYSECNGLFTYESTISTPFRFELVGIYETEDDAGFDLDSDDSDDLRSSLRNGTCADLNIFTGTTNTLGFAYLPPSCPSSDGLSVRNELDAVMIRHTSLPDGSTIGFNQGDTIVHEVGHWLGLDHTFLGGCFGDGDAVADTPAEASAGFGCDIGRDTCATIAGDDPIHNYMDYSDDCCMYRFTEGQVDRMIAQVGLYRQLISETLQPTSTSSPSGSPTTETSVSPAATPTTNCNHPNDGFDYSSCNVDDKCFLGDGKCDSSDNYNTAECNFDGGDCSNDDNIDCKISDRVKGLIKAGTRFLRK
jgi:hypothetical protein